jgi:hypothetical protein
VHKTDLGTLTVETEGEGAKPEALKPKALDGRELRKPHQRRLFSGLARTNAKEVASLRLSSTLACTNTEGEKEAGI